MCRHIVVIASACGHQLDRPFETCSSAPACRHVTDLTFVASRCLNCELEMTFDRCFGTTNSTDFTLDALNRRWVNAAAQRTGLGAIMAAFVPERIVAPNGVDKKGYIRWIGALWQSINLYKPQCVRLSEKGSWLLAWDEPDSPDINLQPIGMVRHAIEQVLKLMPDYDANWTPESSFELFMSVGYPDFVAE